MNQARRNRIIRISYLLNALLFFVGGFELLGNDKLGFAIIQFMASSLNLFGFLFTLNPKTNTSFKQSILVLDILVAMSVAVNYAQEGKQYIQYAWALAAVMNLVALVVLSRKRSKDQRHIGS